jgi:DNA-binding PadR family transcriptional regulator
MTSSARSAKTSLGEFEHHVLLAALRLGREAFTASILTELEQRTRREVSAAAVYIALRRLERSGLVTSEMRTGPGTHENRERRYVRVTPRGIRLVREARERFHRLWDGLGDLVKEKGR